MSAIDLCHRVAAVRVIAMLLPQFEVLKTSELGRWRCAWQDSQPSESCSGFSHRQSPCRERYGDRHATHCRAGFLTNKGRERRRETERARCF